MKTAPVVAATIAFDAQGIAFSSLYNDRYHPRAGALEQAAHVFLQGNGLPNRWHGRERFVVLETGFGLGNNFLATWNAWRSDPRRGERLHFISIEKHPLSRADLARVHADSRLPALAGALLQAWPPLTPNLHRLDFDDARVQLTLALGDVSDWLPEIVASVDAFYLDGFAPDRNPAMWQPRVFKALARLAAPGATAATWSVARTVRSGLTTAGFEVRSAPGSADKREITLARFAPRFVPRRAPTRLASAACAERHAVVIGAGLAGCAAAWALADQGWRSTLFERLPAIAGAASGNRAGIFHGIVNPQDGTHARFNRAAALQAQGAVGVAIEHYGAPGQLCGVLRLEQSTPLEAMQATLATLGLPPDYVLAFSADDASRASGLPLPTAAWFFAGGGWVQPPALAASFLQRSGGSAIVRSGLQVSAMRRSGERWQLLDAASRVLDEAVVVVLANSFEAAGLLGGRDWPLHLVRGQTSEFPAATSGLRLPLLPVAGNGYVLPALPGGIALCGATAQRDDLDGAPRLEDHRHNLAQLGRLTGSAPEIDPSALAGRVGWRCVADDRLPLIGGVPAPQRLQEPGIRLDQPRFVPRTPGLFVFSALASRGISWAALGAQSLASLISGAPCPLEASLLDAVDAGRFVSRAACRAAPR
jgi:tRNA 5-methylaminomethyl-2-thiouridine biosynthesis bifunctional protein